jgi:sulfur-carrier protein
MAIDVLYFAWVREGVGRGSETVDPPKEVETVAQLIDWLAGLGPGHAGALAERDKLRAAVDQRFVDAQASIVGAREVAIFPPVTGG